MKETILGASVSGTERRQQGDRGNPGMCGEGSEARASRGLYRSISRAPASPQTEDLKKV